MPSFRSLLVVSLFLLAGLFACIEPSRQRVVYDQRGIEVGIEHDPSTDRSSPPTVNNHPARLTEEDVRRLLEVFRVGGYSGTLGGLLANPRPFPVFTNEELRIIAGPVATALSQAGVRDRVYFSIPNLQVRYSDDRTAGALFLRGPYLHLMLRDHSALLRTDTASGDADKDPRETKGMRLSVLAPARVATLAPEDEPRWSPLEKVYTRVNVNEVLYAPAATPSPMPTVQVAGPTPAPPPAPLAQAAPAPKVPPQVVTEQAEDLRQQIRELTSSNLDLRARLQDQAEQVKAIQEELERLKQELKKAPPKKSQTKPKSAPLPQ